MCNKHYLKKNYDTKTLFSMILRKHSMSCNLKIFFPLFRTLENNSTMEFLKCYSFMVELQVTIISKIFQTRQGKLNFTMSYLKDPNPMEYRVHYRWPVKCCFKWHNAAITCSGSTMTLWEISVCMLYAPHLVHGLV